MFSNSESVSFCIFSCSKSHLLVKPYLDRILRMNLVIINTVLIRVYELFKNIFFLFNWGFFYFKSYLALQCFSKLDYKISISKCKETKKNLFLPEEENILPCEKWIEFLLQGKLTPLLDFPLKTVLNPDSVSTVYIFYITILTCFVWLWRLIFILVLWFFWHTRPVKVVQFYLNLFNSQSLILIMSNFLGLTKNFKTEHHLYSPFVLAHTQSHYTLVMRWYISSRIRMCFYSLFKVYI